MSRFACLDSHHCRAATEGLISLSLLNSFTPSGHSVLSGSSVRKRPWVFRVFRVFGVFRISPIYPKYPISPYAILYSLFWYCPCVTRTISVDCTSLSSHFSIVLTLTPRTSACFMASCLVKQSFESVDEIRSPQEASRRTAFGSAYDQFRQICELKTKTGCWTFFRNVTKVFSKPSTYYTILIYRRLSVPWCISAKFMLCNIFLRVRVLKYYE